MDLSWLMLIALIVVVYAIAQNSLLTPSREVAKLKIEFEILKKINRMIELISIRTEAQLKDRDDLAALYQEEYDKLEAEVARLKLELEEYKK